MNERIRELALQANLEMCGCGCDMPTRQSAKFAELIVQECQSRVEQYINRCGQIGSLPDTVIKKHFGVE